MADCTITEVYTGIGGGHIRSLNSSGMVAIKEKEVTQADIDRVIETAKAIAIPERSADPAHPAAGIHHRRAGGRARAARHERRAPGGEGPHRHRRGVRASRTSSSACAAAGSKVEDVMLQPLASAQAVLNDDEKELGVCLMDVGGGTTDLAVFTGGAIRHTAVIPIAGDQVTNDIAMTLRTPTKDAEELKLRHGCALRQLADPERHHRGARRRRARAAQAVAPDARRGDRAAHRGAVHARPGGAAAQRVRGAALVGHRAHRGLGAAGGNGRAGRGSLSSAGAHRRAGVRRRARRRRAQPALRDRGRACCSRAASISCAPSCRARRAAGLPTWRDG